MVSDKLVRYTPTRIKYFRIVTDQWLNEKYSWHKKILSEKRFPIFFWTLKCYTCCIVKNFVPKKQNNMLSLNKRIMDNSLILIRLETLFLFRYATKSKLTFKFDIITTDLDHLKRRMSAFMKLKTMMILLCWHYKLQYQQ